MRIGFFSDSYYPYISGVVRSIDLFSRDLRNMGHQVYIFAPDYPQCKEEPFIYRFSSLPAPHQKDFRIAIPFKANLIDKLKELKLDIIHTHSPFMMGRLAMVLAKKLALPLAFTYHTNYEEYAHYLPLTNKTARRLTFHLAREFCNRCDFVVAPSSATKELLQGGGVTSSLEVIPTGVDYLKFKEGNKGWLKKCLGLESSDQVLLYVGRLGDDKNIFFLLDLVKDLMEENPNLYLVLVGKGPAQEELTRQVATWQLEDRFFFIGIVEPQKIANYYLGADIFVFPSLAETQGLVILEAMAAGLAVVAVDQGGPKNVVKDGVDGFLLNPEKEEFKRIVRKLLLDKKKRQAIACKALEKAQRLSSYQMAKQLELAYSRLLDKGSKFVSR